MKRGESVAASHGQRTYSCSKKSGSPRTDNRETRRALPSNCAGGPSGPLRQIAFCAALEERELCRMPTCPVFGRSFRCNHLGCKRRSPSNRECRAFWDSATELDPNPQPNLPSGHRTRECGRCWPSGRFSPRFDWECTAQQRELTQHPLQGRHRRRLSQPPGSVVDGRADQLRGNGL